MNNDEILEEKKFKKYLYLAMGTLLFVGSVNLIIFNYQLETTYEENGKIIEWRHPFFMGAIVSLG
jgi:hypothetical protein